MSTRCFFHIERMVGVHRRTQAQPSSRTLQSHQHLGREKEIQRYLQRMERVIAQAERLHLKTHVQPARRRHSLSNSQVHMHAFILYIRYMLGSRDKSS